MSQLNFLPRKWNNQVLKLSEVSPNKTIDITTEICYATGVSYEVIHVRQVSAERAYPKRQEGQNQDLPVKSKCRG